MLQPLPNAKVRLKTNDALYRCRLIAVESEGWRFAAPLQRDAFVPIPVGTSLTCEVIARGGVLLFHSKVISREDGTILVETPQKPLLSNRREGIRRVDIPMEMMIGGKTGDVIDVSKGGAKVRLKGYQKEGDLVSIRMPDGKDINAEVIDAIPDSQGSVIRLRFDSQIPLSD